MISSCNTPSYILLIFIHIGINSWGNSGETKPCIGHVDIWVRVAHGGQSGQYCTGQGRVVTIYCNITYQKKKTIYCNIPFQALEWDKNYLIILRFYKIWGDQEQGMEHGWLVVCHMGIIWALKCWLGLLWTCAVIVWVLEDESIKWKQGKRKKRRWVTLLFAYLYIWVSKPYTRGGGKKR